VHKNSSPTDAPYGPPLMYPWLALAFTFLARIRYPAVSCLGDWAAPKGFRRAFLFTSRLPLRT
jgi:hypothetical protein